MNLYDIVRRPLDTEKFDRARDAHNQYAFEVDRRASKLEIKSAIEQLFQVNVLEVNTAVLRGKNARLGLRPGQRPNWKRAIVTLAKGEAIALFEGK